MVTSEGTERRVRDRIARVVIRLRSARARVRLPGRCLRPRVIASLRLDRQQHDREPPARATSPPASASSASAPASTSRRRSSRTRSNSTYGRAFLVGLLNTLLVAVDRHRARVDPRLPRRHRAPVAELAGRASIATVYVETLRNIPVLLQLLFWYKAVLSVLPGPRQGYALPLRRQPQQPRPDPPQARFLEPGFSATAIAFLVGDRCGRCLVALGAPAADGDRPAVSRPRGRPRRPRRHSAAGVPGHGHAAGGRVTPS